MARKQTHLGLAAATLAGLVIAACDDPGSRSVPATPGTDTATAAATHGAAEALVDYEAAIALADPYLRVQRLGRVLAAGDDTLLDPIRQTLRRYPTRLSGAEFDLMVRFWAEREPREALAWVARNASPLYRVGAIRTIAEIWAASDPAAALVGVEIPDVLRTDESARAAQVAVVQGWYRSDRASLEEHIRALGTGIQRQRSLFAMLVAMGSEEGSEALIRWADAVPEEDERYKKAVFRQALSALAWLDTEGAARFCEAHCDSAFGQGMRNVLIRSRLRAGDPPAEVVEWVGRFPASDKTLEERKRHSLWVAYSTWAYRDREAAVAWLTEQLERGEQDWLPALYGEYARQRAAEAPAEAIVWAEKIEDENERTQTMVRIARRWLEVDRAAAEAWLAGSSLPPAARASARDLSRPSYLPDANSPSPPTDEPDTAS